MRVREIEFFSPIKNYIIFQPITKTYNSNGYPRICVVDCGLKYNQLRCLLKRGARVDVVPWDHDLKTAEYDGLFLSNGPGDPKMCRATIANIQTILAQKRNKPIFGICLGHQLLSIAAGCITYKMRYLFNAARYIIRFLF